MIELVILVVCAAAVGKRSRQRGKSPEAWFAILTLGWLVLFLLTIAVLGPIGLVLRWMWILGVVLWVEHGGVHGDDAESWRCPDCLSFNDGLTIRCDCGYEPMTAPPPQT